MTRATVNRGGSRGVPRFHPLRGGRLQQSHGAVKGRMHLEEPWKGGPMDRYNWFDPDGLLAQVIPGYEYRQGQVDLAQAMADALEASEPLLAEAGTGIGKSASYLAALIASGKTALISTYTKALQDQLGQKDVPMVQRLP